MITFDTIGAAREGIADTSIKSIPDYLQARYRELRASPSPVDQIVGTGEFIYANRADLPVDVLDLGAGLIAFATTNAWHGLLEGNRGNDIVSVFRRDMGEEPFPGTEFLAEGAEPEPMLGYKIAQPSNDEQPAPPAPAPTPSSDPSTDATGEAA